MTVKPFDMCLGYGVVQELVCGTRKYARGAYIPELGERPDSFILTVGL